MDFKTAVVKSLKYNAVALVPTLIGVGLMIGSIWFGVVDPLFDSVLSVEQADTSTAMEAIETAEYSLWIAITGVVVGYIIYRVGRTAALFQIHGTAVIEEVDEIETETTETDVSTTTTHSEERKAEVTELIEEDSPDIPTEKTNN